MKVNQHLPKVDILIADDSVFFRDHVKASVKSVNIEANFIEVDDGKQLFPAYENYIPEILIIDQKLPNCDVLDFSAKVIEMHPIATIIISVNIVNHKLMKQAIDIGIKKILLRTTDQFSLGSLIKKLITNKVSKYPEFERQVRQNIMSALTLSTLNNSKETSNYVKHMNTSIQKQLEKIERLKNLGGSFEDTIKNLSMNNQNTTSIDANNIQSPQSKFVPQNSPNFFMKEFSDKKIEHILEEKIKQLKESKNETDSTNKKMQEAIIELEEVKQDLAIQKQSLEKQVQEKTTEVLKVEKMATIGELSARIAHDLRNPLSVIKNTSEILKLGYEEYSDDKKTEQWLRLDRAIYRMQHQLEDVLDFLKPTPLQRTITNSSIILNDAINRISIPDNIIIHPPVNAQKIFCDPVKIEIVFVNLMMNAIQAMEGKPGTIDLLVSTDQKTSNYVIIEVKDSGPCIPKHIGEKIFEPLFTTRQIGTGLGLVSCKKIIQEHNGTINFETKIGGGTSFFVKIPADSEWQEISDHTELDEFSNDKGIVSKP